MPSDNQGVVIDTGGLIVTVYDWLAVAPTLSAAITVNVDDPAVVGTPEICPVDPSSDSPGGKEPALTENV